MHHTLSTCEKLWCVARTQTSCCCAGESAEASVGDRIFLLATDLEHYLELRETPDSSMQQHINVEQSSIGPNKRCVDM